MPLDHNSQVIRAIWKNKIFNIWKPIEKNELINPPFIYNFSEKGKTMWTGIRILMITTLQELHKWASAIGFVLAQGTHQTEKQKQPGASMRKPN